MGSLGCFWSHRARARPGYHGLVRAHVQNVPLIGLGVLLTMVAWTLAVPYGAGPDEQAHFARSGATVDLDYVGVTWTGGTSGVFTLDGRYALPPTCYAFQPDVPVTCASSFVTPEVADLPAAANDYQVWPHLLAGVASRIPFGNSLLLARLAYAVVNSLLVTFALAAFRDIGRLGVLVALSPATWLLAGSLNPSSLTIGGGVALWSALVVARTKPIPHWLFASGWCAMTLTRGDGALLAACAVAFAVLLDRNCRSRLIGLKRQALLMCAVASLAASVWAATRESIEDRIVLLAPAVVVGGIACAQWPRPGRFTSEAVRITVGIVTGLVCSALVIIKYGLGAIADVASRTGYWFDGYVILGGWNDVQASQIVHGLWLCLVGSLLAPSLRRTAGRDLGYLAVFVGVALAGSIVAELAVTEGDGQYFQGRYLAPALVGVPIVLAGRVDGASIVRAQSLKRFAVPVWILMSNLQIASALRRWGAGANGSWLPTRWNHELISASVPLVLLVHAIATVVLCVEVSHFFCDIERTDRRGAGRNWT